MKRYRFQQTICCDVPGRERPQQFRAGDEIDEGAILPGTLAACLRGGAIVEIPAPSAIPEVVVPTPPPPPAGPTAAPSEPQAPKQPAAPPASSPAAKRAAKK